MFVLILLILILMILHLLCLRGRKNQPGMETLRGWFYAHRGLHDDERPENSLAAYKAALDKGYGIEFDVHLLKDGSLAVMHDSDLKRTTGREGFMEDLTAQDLENYHLGGTDQTIPTFQQVLDLFDGQAPLIIELKTRNGNADALTEAVCRVLKDYTGPYCVESFDPRCIRWLKRNRPEIVRGQLSENFLRHGDGGNMPKALLWALGNLLTNCLAKPDFIAYRFSDRDNFCLRWCRWFYHVQEINWTIITKEEMRAAESAGNLVIFQDFDPRL